MTYIKLHEFKQVTDLNSFSLIKYCHLPYFNYLCTLLNNSIY
jgi:hypothetical protein